MSSLSSAQAKWERKTAGAGAKWKAAASAAKGLYCDGFSKFAEHQVVDACNEYGAGIDATSAEDYASGVAGKGSKYAAGIRNVA